MNSSQSCRHYDYVIAGAGASGLSLLMRMIASKKFTARKILLVDKEQKTKNDRTWCFWESGAGFFEHLVYKRWKTLRFHSKDISRQFDISPYEYKMIRGIDFYTYCLNIIRETGNVSVRFGNVEEMNSTDDSTWLLVDGEKITAGFIFNSIMFSPPVLKAGGYYLIQHFKGWVIDTTLPVFDENIATLMDFRVSQKYGAAFVYTMPFSSKRALVEYTLFTENLLKPHEYEEGLKQYILTHLQCAEYNISEEEFGMIPMTNYFFPRRKKNIINIGTAGGQTKASSGYTFQFIQKDTQAIVDELSRQSDRLVLPDAGKRFRFYDSVLLNVLATGKLPGDEIFSHIFANNPPLRIFQFLDNESSLAQDVRLINTLPKMPFIKAGLEQIF